MTDNSTGPSSRKVTASRPAIWWQTQHTAQAANPGARIPRGRGHGVLVVAVDTREKYGWRFADRQVTIERRALPTGDYAAIAGEAVVAVVERKTLANLATSLSDGSLAFQMQRLAEAGRSAVVVEGDYPELFRTQPGRGSWLGEMLGRLAVRYPEVPIIFAGSRKFAEEWADRFFGAAACDRTIAQPVDPVRPKTAERSPGSRARGTERMCRPGLTASIPSSWSTTASLSANDRSFGTPQAGLRGHLDGCGTPVGYVRRALGFRPEWYVWATYGRHGRCSDDHFAHRA